jgi:predicted nuclease of predicted toxin-antitoxin system
VRFKVDENLPDELAQALRTAGWDCSTIDDQMMNGSDDETVERVCRAEERILVTFDLGFADVRAFAPGSHAGFIVFRLKNQSKPHTLRVAIGVIEWLRQRELRNELWIVEEDRIRIRGEGETAISLILTRSE